MGHKSQMDIGEAVYGHIYVEELLKAINQIWKDGVHGKINTIV